jgi:eukaryotic-like serine/threonine-protein kinase
MPEIACLRCKSVVDDSLDACPHCEEKITSFQRSYAGRLIDGKYEILERLGMGGMGEIFKVRHIHLGEERVIKIMRANIASDDQALQRFLHEARTSTMIKHRNLAMLYDFSTLDDGSYYMVWEYIDGTNIQKWIAANGPMPPRLATEIAIQTLHGLDHLHQMGLIHRDISPENIMLSQDYQGRLLAKVIDFGIAKQLSEGGGGHGLTQTGMFLGKLKYASPEQAGFMAEGEQLDARSDLYSFGVVFYEMLAGRAPFVASNPQGYILKHATEKPQPISAVNPQVSVPARLEEQVFIALEKEREQRHLSAADFAADLEELRDEIPPDEKYGLGDSKAFTGRTVERTRSGRSTGPSGRSGTAATLAEQPTVIGTAEAATVVDRPAISGQRTVAGTAEDAAPTVAVRTEAPAGEALPRKKTRAPLLAAAAAVAVLIAGGVYMATRTGGEPQTGETSTSGTAIEVPSGPGERTGFVLLAYPPGQLQQILKSDTRETIPFSTVDGNETPLSVELPPGRYDLVVVEPATQEQRTVTVAVAPGEMVRQAVQFRQVDLDKLSETILSTQ